MSIFRKQVKPTIRKTISTTMTLYDVYVQIKLYRKDYKVTFYYSDQPHDRYSDTAVKEEVVLTAKTPVELLDEVKELLESHNSD